ncbi:MAG: hypothetical protein KF901_02635 [Myxococcales bacterium]|nr:hypothetical protein [Myxococcales bacterium]
MYGNDEGVLRRTYRIGRWSAWDDQVNGFANDFCATFGTYPNLLQASDVTFRRIDMAARKENVYSPAGEPAEEGAYTPLGEFVRPHYALTFVVEPSLDDGQVVLFYDADPDGDGGIPLEDTVPSREVLAARGPRVR